MCAREGEMSRAIADRPRRNLDRVHFAFKTSSQETTWTDLLAVWKVADDIELFESGWTFDHLYPISTDGTGPCMDGWITLTALAQATTRLRMGTLLTGIHYRHPAILAKMATTLDVVSGGPLKLGIGAGWNEEESVAYGFKASSTLAQRSDRFEEACEVLGPSSRRRRPSMAATTRSVMSATNPSQFRAPIHRSASVEVVRRGRYGPRPGSPSTGTLWVARRRSSPATATSCISTARNSAVT